MPDQLSIFDISEVMSSDSSLNQLSLFLIDNLVPKSFSSYSAQFLEQQYLKLTQMKIFSAITKHFKLDH